MSDSEHARLLTLLRTLSYVRRDVVLASGKRSDFYIDCRVTALHPEGIVLCGRQLLALLRAGGPTFDAVAGPSVGADPLVSAVVYTSRLVGAPVPGLFVRKAAKGHGTGRRIEGTGNVAPGARIAVVEDVLTTGGSAVRTIDALRESGFDVVRLVALVDRQEGGLERVAAHGLVAEALFSRSEIEAAGCAE